MDVNATANGTSTVGTQATGQTVEAQAGQGTSPQPEAEGVKQPLPTSVPYERFQEMNSKYRELEANVDKRAQALAAEQLYKMSIDNPELGNRLFGASQQTPTDAKPQPPTQPSAQQPQQPDLNGKVDQIVGWIEGKERKEQLESIADRVQREMDKHDIFKGDVAYELGTGQIANLMAQHPNVPHHIIVKTVADKLGSFSEAVKSSYLAGKQTATNTTPINSGGGAPAAQPNQKFRFGDGTAVNALAEAIRAG